MSASEGKPADKPVPAWVAKAAARPALASEAKAPPAFKAGLHRPAAALKSVPRRPAAALKFALLTPVAVLA